MIVSGIFYDATGVLPSINIVFRATRTTLNGVLMGSTASVETQEDGSYAIELEPGYYDVNWQTPGGRSIRLGDIVADASGEMTLPQALEASPTPITQEAADDILVLMRVEADRAEAEADRAEAEADRAEAEADRALAEADRAFSEAGNAAQSATAASDSADSAEGAAQSASDDKDAVSTLATQVNADAASAVAAKTAAEAARDQAQAISDPEAAIEANFDIWIKDKEREQFEAATGGACTIERTADGDAAHMFILPKMTWEDLVPSGELGTGVHEAFIEDGVEKSELLIGMYQAASMTGSGNSSTRLTSQPGLVPRRSISRDASVSAAQAAGLTLMSNWEWSAIAFWCMANGFQPRGNTSNSKSHSHPHEQGRRVEYDNTETGSGPAAWRHNNAAQGIADLVGNVWEWVWGFKMVDGRIFLAPDNDKSLVESSWVDTEWDMPSASSSNWANFYSAENETPLDVRRALIMPNGVADPDGSMWTNLEGERFPYRGGTRVSAGSAGLGALALTHERTSAGITRGLRFSRLV